MLFPGIALNVREGVVGSLGECKRSIEPLTFGLGSGDYAVVCDGSRSRDVAHTDLRFDEHTIRSAPLG